MREQAVFPAGTPPRAGHPALSPGFGSFTCFWTVITYEHWGWTGASLVATAFPVFGLLCWLATGRHERA